MVGLRRSSAFVRILFVSAAGGIDVGTQAKLTPFGTPEQATDASSPRVQQMNALLAGLAFKGLAVGQYARTQPDASDPSLLIGNDILKVIVFGSAKDAQKLRTPTSTMSCPRAR